MTMRETEQDVLEVVAGMVREIIGEEWVHDTPITADTSFAHDLELESIEFVALAELVKARYGRRVDFTTWLSNMELRQIIGLKVGELVEYIVRCLSNTTAA